MEVRDSQEPDEYDPQKERPQGERHKILRLNLAAPRRVTHLAARREKPEGRDDLRRRVHVGKRSLRGFEPVNRQRTIVMRRVSDTFGPLIRRK
jgi:hypothetical protein